MRMLEINNWQTLSLDIREVKLDPLNVRLDMDESDLDPKLEADAIKLLFEQAKTLAIVEGIAAIGYLTHELPVVVKRGKDYVVVEGNRRVAALKVIQNPALADKAFSRVSAAVKTMTKASRDALIEVEFKLAPNQDQADQFVAALHTANLRMAWKPNRQVAFFAAQLAKGLTVEELRVRFPTASVNKFIKQLRFIEMLQHVPYSDPTLVKWIKSDAPKVTVLERIYQSADFRTLTGFQVDKDGLAAVTISDRCWNAIANHLVSKMADGTVDTRSAGTTKSEAFITLMNELGDIKAQVESSPGEAVTTSRSGTGSGSPGAVPGQPGSGETQSGTQGSGAAPPATKPATSSLPFSKAPPKVDGALKYLDSGPYFKIPSDYLPGINILLTEMSKLSIERFPNVLLDSLRTFLEKVIKSHADSLNVDIAKAISYRGPHVQLGDCLKWLQRHHEHDADWVDALGALNKLANGQLLAGSAKHLNSVNHNHLATGSEAEVRDAWVNLLPVLRAMMPK